MMCDICKKIKDNLKAATVSGKYYPRLCFNCLHGFTRHANDAEYQRDRSREDHAKDIEQPFIGGKANPAFAHAYPEEAKDYFSKEELKEM